MMATTHAFVGLSLAVGVALVAPEFAAVVAIAGLLGGLFPDFDLPAGTDERCIFRSTTGCSRFQRRLLRLSLRPSGASPSQCSCSPLRFTP